MDSRKLKPKLCKDGSVIISRVKDTFDKTDLKKAYYEGGLNGKSFDQWFNENY